MCLLMRLTTSELGQSCYCYTETHTIKVSGCNKGALGF